MATHPVQYTPTPTTRVVRCLLSARSALMKLRCDIEDEVDRPLLADRLDAHCENICQALKLLDPISVGTLTHEGAKAVPVAEDCDGDNIRPRSNADVLARNDYLPTEPDTNGPDQPNYADADTEGA